MGDLTRNLSRREFECECGCGMDTVDFPLPLVLQDVCDYFLMTKTAKRVRIDITGPNRCFEHNEKVQAIYNPDYIPGTSRSTHMEAKAADYKIFVEDVIHGWEQVPPQEIHDYLCKKYPDKYGFIVYNNRNHTDTRSTKYRGDRT